LIRDAQLEPSEFSWDQSESREYGSSAAEFKTLYHERLTHRPTQAFVSFQSASEDESQLHLHIWPGYGIEKRFTTNRFDVSVHHWIDRIRKNYVVPDLWAQVQAPQAIPDAAHGKLVEPFTEAELKQLDIGLAEIEEYVLANQQLDPLGEATVRRRFKYLREAARRAGSKVDWLNLFMGTVFSLMAERVLDPAFYQPLMAHAATVLNNIFHLGLKLLGG
jgi:hypothetical protein